MNKVYCTPACEYWYFRESPACNTVAPGRCNKYGVPTEKSGSCPPKSYSKYDFVKLIKRKLGLERKIK